MLPNMTRRDAHLLTVPPQDLHPDAVHVSTVLYERLSTSARRIMLEESVKLAMAARQPGMSSQVLDSFARLGVRRAFPRATDDQLRALVFVAVLQNLRLPAPPLPAEAHEKVTGLLTIFMGSIKAIAQTHFDGLE